MTYEPSTVSQQRFALGDFELVSSAIIENCFLSYVMHGTPSQDGTNVIVVTSSIAGNAHRLDFLIGTGKAFDPQTYCIIGIDALGNGRSSSPSNSETQPGMRFPRFTIRNMVNSQQRLLTEKFCFQRVPAMPVPPWVVCKHLSGGQVTLPICKHSSRWCRSRGHRPGQ